MPQGQSPRALFPQSVVGFTVQANGNIPVMPARFGMGSHEMVLWVVGNTSGQLVTVKLQNFLRDGQANDPVEPCVWLVSDSVQVANGQTAFIAGIKHPNYQQRFLVDRVKYTIHVESAGFAAVDFDPDGDIKP